MTGAARLGPVGGTRRWPPRVFLAGQAVSLLGDGVAVLAIPLLVLDLTRSPLISGISAASVTIGYLFVGLPAGVLIDRLDPWRVLIAMDAARAVLFGALFGLAVARLLAVWLILVIALAAGACAVFFETALVVVVRDLFAGPGLIRANSVIEVASQVSLIIGPAAVGVLAAAGRIRVALLADALTFLVSLVSLAVVARRTPRRPPRRGGPGQRAGPGHRSTAPTISRASRSACRSRRCGPRCSRRSTPRPPRSISARCIQLCRPRSSRARKTRWR